MHAVGCKHMHSVQHRHATPPHLFQAVLMVWVWLALLEGAAQYVQFLGVGVHCVPAQVACARHSMDALHSCDRPEPR